MNIADHYSTVDIRPDPSGWRALYIDEEGHGLEPVVGWLIQEHEDGGRRRVVAGVVEDGRLAPVDEWDEPEWRAFARLLPPGSPEPTAETIAKERAEQIARRDRWLARQEQP